MKAAGTYNPVTQSAGGSLEVSRSDYQERRTDWLFWVVILVGIAAVGYFLITSFGKTLASAIPNAIGGAAETVANAAAAVTGAAAATQQKSVDTVVKAAGKTPGEAATQEYWTAADTWLNGGMVARTTIAAGNTLLSMPVVDTMGVPLLQKATVQGAAFGQDLAAYGDVERLQNDPLKPLIITGEAISRTLGGFSPYEAGKATSAWLQGLPSLQW